MLYLNLNCTGFWFMHSFIGSNSSAQLNICIKHSLICVLFFENQTKPSMHNSVQAAPRVRTDDMLYSYTDTCTDCRFQHIWWYEEKLWWEQFSVNGEICISFMATAFPYGQNNLRYVPPPPPPNTLPKPPARPQGWASFAWQNSILSTLYLPRSLLWCVVIALVWRWCAGWEGLGMGMGMRGGGVAEKSVLQWKCAPTEA